MMIVDGLLLTTEGLSPLVKVLHTRGFLISLLILDCLLKILPYLDKRHKYNEKI